MWKLSQTLVKMADTEPLILALKNSSASVSSLWSMNFSDMVIMFSKESFFPLFGLVMRFESIMEIMRFRMNLACVRSFR